MSELLQFDAHRLAFHDELMAFSMLFQTYGS